MKLIAAVDPGYTGAVAFVDTDGVLCDCVDMPITGEKKRRHVSAVLFRNELFQHGADIVVIEDVHAMPAQGVSSSHKFGRAIGVVEGASADLPTFWLTPQVWKRHHGLIGKEKDAARRLCLERWPDDAELFARKKDGGRADACLIALCWIEQNR